VAKRAERHRLSVERCSGVRWYKQAGSWFDRPAGKPAILVHQGLILLYEVDSAGGDAAQQEPYRKFLEIASHAAPLSPGDQSLRSRMSLQSDGPPPWATPKRAGGAKRAGGSKRVTAAMARFLRRIKGLSHGRPPSAPELRDGHRFRVAVLLPETPLRTLVSTAVRQAGVVPSPTTKRA
jgi:hypothetical protein